MLRVITYTTYAPARAHRPKHMPKRAMLPHTPAAPLRTIPSGTGRGKRRGRRRRWVGPESRGVYEVVVAVVAVVAAAAEDEGRKG